MFGIMRIARFICSGVLGQNIPFRFPWKKHYWWKKPSAVKSALKYSRFAHFFLKIYKKSVSDQLDNERSEKLILLLSHEDSHKLKKNSAGDTIRKPRNV